MTDDVVAELDAWLGAWEGPDDYRVTVQRARDEIVALRERLDRQPQGMDAIAHVRAEARAEALAECIRICPECAYRIMALDTVGARHLRALKDKRDE